MRFLLSLVFTIALVLTVALAVPFGIVALGFWAADGAWEFEARGFKYWLFVKGSRLERLGTVEPIGAVKYSSAFRKGHFRAGTLQSTKAILRRKRLPPPMASAASR